MSPTRIAFEERFGFDQAEAVEAAAVEHANGTNSERLGSDPFKWALLICLGYECISKDGYRKYHGITAPWEDIKQWIKDHADLGTHDGDFDYLAAFCGTYNEFVKTK